MIKVDGYLSGSDLSNVVNGLQDIEHSPCRLKLGVESLRVLVTRINGTI